jgi:hypothetical protein
MLLFLLPFGIGLAGVPKNLPHILADCVGDLILRDTAHVANTGGKSVPIELSGRPLTLCEETAPLTR